MTVEYLYHKVLVAHILGGLEIDGLAFVLRVADLLLHHTLTHGGHLRAALGIDDSGHDVASEGRTYL